MWLSLDTSTLTLSIALVDADGTVRLERSEGPPKRQSEMLPGVIDEVLASQNLKLAELDGFISGLGPGSFTGLRIGLATLKGLAYAERKPLTGASSLLAIALDAPEGRELFCCAPVKKGELYLVRARRTGSTVTALAPECVRLHADFVAELNAAPDALAIGPGAVDARAALEALGVSADRLSQAVPYPRAAAIAQLADKTVTFDNSKIFSLEPHYLRSSGAEDNPKFPPLKGPEPTARLKEE